MEGYTAELPLTQTNLCSLGPSNKAKLKRHHHQSCQALLRVPTLSPDSLLIVRKDIPFTQTRSLIIVPHHALAGLLNALHFKLQHPSKTQLSALCHRYFFALDMDKEIAAITCHCPQCRGIASLPCELEELATTPSP